ncbi:MAG: HAMP domain-containing histidine kinase [Actinobacteria bacterium]|nr:HAMP domain-containing histidine kinase [Actinomycetota bacterium]MCB9389992.1 HAMP domain-containing histidine kinase [Acidimicrobiia bacterium]
MSAWWRRHPLGIRGRSTLAAVLIVAVVLSAGAGLFAWAVERSLLSDLDRTIEQAATDRAQLLSGGADPASLVSAGPNESFVIISSDEGTLAQGGFLQPTGKVPKPRPDHVDEYRLDVREMEADERSWHDGDRDHHGSPTAGPTGPGSTSSVTTANFDDDFVIHDGDGDAGDDGDDDDEQATRVRLASATTNTDTYGEVTVLVGSARDNVGSALKSVTRTLIWGVLATIALVGLAVWWASRRALRPVEAAARSAATISDAGDPTRLSSPGTGDEIDHLITTLNDMLDRLAAQDTAQRRFVADASHELKSPVASLALLAETTTLDDPRWPQVQHRMMDEARRLGTTVEDLLFLASRDEGRSLRSEKLFSLDDLLFDEAAHVTLRFDGRVDISGIQPTEAFGAPNEIRRVIRNLADNASRYATSVIALACGTDGSGTWFSVSDDGPGIPAEQRATVFDRFVRLDESRTKADHRGHAGLGLAIVSEVVKGHGGSVALSDAPNLAEAPRLGTRFLIHLPSSQ